MSTVRVSFFDKEAVRRALAEYLRGLTERHREVEEVVLFGSLASGIPVPGSDVDLLIVLSHSDRPFLDRIPEFLPGGFPVGMDVFPYTRVEVERMREDRTSLVSRALREGVTVFRRTGGPAEASPRAAEGAGGSSGPSPAAPR